MANVGDCTAMTGPMHLGPAADGLVSGMWRQDARGPVCLRPTTGCGREAPCSPDALYQPGSGTGSGLLADLCAMGQSVYRSQRFERENRIGQRLADREFEQCEFLLRRPFGHFVRVRAAAVLDEICDPVDEHRGFTAASFSRLKHERRPRAALAAPKHCGRARSQRAATCWLRVDSALPARPYDRHSTLSTPKRRRPEATMRES